MKKYKEYEVIIIGGGHAGIEAAIASAGLGVKTLVLTISLDTVGLMPCNSAIGGPGRGQLVREIDALGGIMGKNADLNFIHNRIINTSKGLAIRTLRSVVDKRDYFVSMKKIVEDKKNIDMRQGLVVDLSKNEGLYSVKTSDGVVYEAKSVVLATGTFLRGKIFWGKHELVAGRMGEINSIKLAVSAEKLGLRFGRLRTETPPRIDKKTINKKLLVKQDYDEIPEYFSHGTEKKEKDQVYIYKTFVGPDCIELIRKNINKSAVYGDRLLTESPKYCPSIEDKIYRFNEKKRHPIFIQPEGRRTNEMYLHGLHTTFSEDIQEEIISKIKGLENAIITRPGYGVEYDYLLSGQISHSLESKSIKGLFFAGQINGTTGYEEAAAQGVIAGINAANSARNKKALIVEREDGYIGVMIDDIVCKGITEPYRMLTSKNEYRLIHRHDNALFRMNQFLKKIGKERKAKTIEERQNLLNDVKEDISRKNKKNVNKIYNNLRNKNYEDKKVKDLLKDYRINIRELRDIIINIEYENYIKRDLEKIKIMKKEKKQRIPQDLDYEKIKNVSKEAKKKLKEVRPQNLSQLKKIEGVRPLDILVVQKYISNVSRET